MRSFLLCLLLLSGVSVRSADAPELLDSSPSVYGEWQGYRVREGLLLGRADVHYLFGPEGWTIEDSEGMHPQAWFRLQGHTLYLGPAGTTAGETRSAILVPFLDPDVFEIPNPSMPQGITLRFRRMTAPQTLVAEAMAGFYHMTLQRAGSDTVATSPFLVALDATGRYTLVSFPPVEEGYATGRYEVKGDTLTFLPDTPQEGFWEKPVFFLYQGELLYDNTEYSFQVRLVPGMPPETPTTP